MEQIRNHVDGYELQQVTLGIVITAGMVSNLTVETVKNEYFYNDSIAHGFYYGCTVCPGAHKHLHGELVSMGILVLLTLDKQFETRDRLFPFYKALGLPMTMEAIELPESDLPTLVDKAATMDNWHYVPTPITKEQFTQIAMIAQGDFQKLLLADTAERGKIFRQLFHTELFSDLQNRLREEKNACDAEYREIRRSIAQSLDEGRDCVGEPDLEERLSELRKVKLRARWRQAGALKALTDRGSGRLKKSGRPSGEAGRPDTGAGRIPGESAPEWKRRKELEEREKGERTVPSGTPGSGRRLGGGEKLRGCSAGAGPDDPGMYGMGKAVWGPGTGSVPSGRSGPETGGGTRGLERLLKRQAELDQELLAEKREIRSLSEADGERERLLGRQTGLQNRRNGLEGKFSQWKEVREQLAGNRERLSRLSEQEAGERERKDALEQSFLEMEGAETREQAMVHEAERCTEQRRKLDLLDRASGMGRKGCAGQRIPGSRLGSSGRLPRRISLP